MTMNRKRDFEKIKESVKKKTEYESEKSLLFEGDSLEIIKSFPDHSVSLILTDPPYHTTQKRNIYGDTTFKQDEKYLEWMTKFADEWARILKPNGSLFCFCSSPMVGRLENVFSDKFNILSQIVWTKPNDPGFDGWKQKMKKESLRQWYDHSERIIFAEPAANGNLHRSYFGNLLRKYKEQSGLTSHKLTEMIGAYGKVNHGGAVSNWEAGRNVPSKEQYEKMRVAILSTGKVKSMPPYQDVVRPFIIDKTKEFTDIWTFPNIRPYKGKHPAEKPIALLEHAIATTTFEEDIVLDCFAGSGTTGFAALKQNRLSISIDIESKLVNKIKKVLKRIEDTNYKVFPDNYDPKSIMSDEYQTSLFEK